MYLYRLGGKRLAMVVPPEPDDVNWENVNIRGKDWYVRSVHAPNICLASLAILRAISTLILLAIEI